MFNDHAGTRDGGPAEIRALGDGIGAVENQSAIVGDRAGCREAACRAPCADLECAGADGGCSAVGIVAGEGEGAGGVLGERTRAADDAGEGLVVCAAVDQGGIVGNSSCVASRSEAARCADLECAGADGGGAGVGVVAGEGEGAGSIFCKRAGGGADGVADRGVPGAADGESKSAADRTGEGEQARIGVDTGGGGEGNGPRVGVVAGDVAQATAGADAGATKRKSLGAYGDAALKFQGGSGGN